MTFDEKKDLIGWDITNWFKAIPYWERHIKIETRDKVCLELGASNGGLSLWMARHFNTVICSDLKLPGAAALKIHSKYECKDRIRYEAVDATNIPYENYFDVVAFKSIVGGIAGFYGSNAYKAKTIKQIYRTLKPGGTLVFAENLKATRCHAFLRKHFGTKNWNYLHLDELKTVFSDFKQVQYTTVGFFGCLGRTEKQRNILGKIDSFIERFIPCSWHYIVIGVAKK
ncbi:class I SAM-dependent methyltransferase [Pedobacter agri]|uniref:class I SAM-dependent methyltransferase n=1 Tax=Pedobacter agri TaxID=454586 RepID=UPI00292E820C|nr:methyltransferase domain-containing protein [Pedobacter agri]